ncbi:flavin reductase family protein [Streptomyces sp. NPDC096310]|uniref:flavin reductase family protein n=1 Tax=Streptomyces sp. NPDC096310 TaxID=3366082 RepID=UPI00381CA348
MAEPTPHSMRWALGAFPTGITVVSALIDGKPVGLTANSFTSVSLEPPLVSVNIMRTSTTWPLLRRAEHWGISVLGDHQAAQVTLLSRPASERFNGIDWEAGDDGSVLLPGANATFRVSVESELEAGDHILLLLRVLDLDRAPAGDPLVFHGSQIRHLAA